MKRDAAKKAGILDPLDQHFASFMERLSGPPNDTLWLAAALASHATHLGHICVDLNQMAERPLLTSKGEREGPPLPDLPGWRESLRNSGVVGAPGDYAPLILDEKDRLYLQRYWTYQDVLASWISKRAGETENGPGDKAVKGTLETLFPAACPGDAVDWQKVAAFVAARKGFCVISGGPGTGKTTTVTRILALLIQCLGPPAPRIALAAPTGKGAARLEESIRRTVGSLVLQDSLKTAIPDRASTLHRLLGTVGGFPSSRRRDQKLLPYDVVVVDEASMVDFALFARLVLALRAGARLILLGDKDQLASVEAGAVLGDICGRDRAYGFSRHFTQVVEAATGCSLEAGAQAPQGEGIWDCVVELRRNYRFGAQSGIRGVSRAVNRGDGEGALGFFDDPAFGDIEWIDTAGRGGVPEDLLREAVEGFRACITGRDPLEAFAAFDAFRILCAVREGPFGVRALNAAVERFLLREGMLHERRGGGWYRGRPVLITRNDYGLGLYNGDTGLLLPDRERGGELRVFFPAGEGAFKTFHPSRLPEHETVFAMTVHKGQGSEFNHVLLVLPNRDTPLLTRELLYTGITRAKERLSLLAPRDLFTTAASRRIKRASGLLDALWGAVTPATGGDGSG